MDLQVANKVVVVTGGAKGIGKAISIGFLKEGALVAVIDKDEQAMTEFCSEYCHLSKKLMCVAADLADEASCITAIEKIKDGLGSISILVNNAGVNDGVPLGDSAAAFVESLHKNLVHYYVIAGLIIEDLVANKGCIINISSKVALTGQGYTSGYAAAKGGILALTREWAAQYARSEVRVNAVVPAEVMTPLYESWINKFDNPAEKLKEIENKIPLGSRLTSPEEIASTVLFLSSAHASNITGQYIFVDGGYVHLDRGLV